jgi:hypothetical protein
MRLPHKELSADLMRLPHKELSADLRRLPHKEFRDLQGEMFFTVVKAQMGGQH